MEEADRFHMLFSSKGYDALSSDTVNDLGFRHIVKTFEPHYTPPDRKTISTHYMQDLYLSDNVLGFQLEVGNYIRTYLAIL